MVEGVGFEIRKVGHAGAGVQIVSSPPEKRYSKKLYRFLIKNHYMLRIIIPLASHNMYEVNFNEKTGTKTE